MPYLYRCRQCRAEYDRQGYEDLTKDRAEPVKTFRHRSLRSAILDDELSRRA